MVIECLHVLFLRSLIAFKASKIFLDHCCQIDQFRSDAIFSIFHNSSLSLFCTGTTFDDVVRLVGCNVYRDITFSDAFSKHCLVTMTGILSHAKKLAMQALD
jgi:hypothetical protein